jgi:hypothetical protein
VTDWTPSTLKEHQDAINHDRAMIGIVTVCGLLGIGGAIIWGMMKATSVALDAANEKALTHNGLLGQIQRIQQTFITKGMVVMAFTAALGWGGLAWQIFRTR